ncbi:eukaryotic translation initiation factor 4E member 3 [Tieghemostelium lacteum]|uniref:Eukaryotic translation initiation factor 4E member 3 n=1 Tax=Tieghemostelium lacteum TaxID=361077 RepID=A0A151ZC10_TIELA|nr:eukaryotic translation initiation factor 4E member 3 [Tieghemostelium lacteum]|eukprot:KYQ91469.1 eukaryotic translation initiation factor 4E member 3 [Tieghemostelium lacteum]
MTEVFPNTFNKGELKKEKKKLSAQEKIETTVQPTQHQIHLIKNEPILFLENEWCFWEDHYTNHDNARASKNEFENSLKMISKFNSIQGFWEKFNILPQLDKIPNNSCFHLMKSGIRPVWEDPENNNGGTFILKVKKFQTNEIWNELVLSVIGEQFGAYLEECDDICGLSIRKKQGMDFNTIHIWNRNKSGKDAIFRALKQLFPVLLDECIFYYYRVNKQQQENLNLDQHDRLKESASAPNISLEKEMIAAIKEYKEEGSNLSTTSLSANGKPKKHVSFQTQPIPIENGEKSFHTHSLDGQLEKEIIAEIKQDVQEMIDNKCDLQQKMKSDDHREKNFKLKQLANEYQPLMKSDSPVNEDVPSPPSDHLLTEVDKDIENTVVQQLKEEQKLENHELKNTIQDYFDIDLHGTNSPIPPSKHHLNGINQQLSIDSPKCKAQIKVDNLSDKPTIEKI